MYNESSNEPVNESVNESVNKSLNESVNESVNWLVYAEGIHEIVSIWQLIIIKFCIL